MSSAFEVLVGKKLDPARIELGWKYTVTKDVNELYGSISAHRFLNEELEASDQDSGMAVMATASVKTDSDHTILEVTTNAYATYGAAGGRPVQCDVLPEDEAFLTQEIARFLTEPGFAGGRLVEDQAWLKGMLPKFKALSAAIKEMSTLAEEYVGRGFYPEKAGENGWGLDPTRTSAFGYLELITDLDRSFWLMILINCENDKRIEDVKFVLSDEWPPTPDKAIEGVMHSFIEGFNAARLEKCLEVVTAPKEGS